MKPELDLMSNGKVIGKLAIEEIDTLKRLENTLINFIEQELENPQVEGGLAIVPQLAEILLKIKGY